MKKDYSWMIGKKFGYREVIGLTPDLKTGTTATICKCKCGKISVVRRGDIKDSKQCKSCNMTRHGNAKIGAQTVEYRAWKNMKTRCYLPCSKDYHNYGGRGIRVCKRWKHNFQAFLSDMGKKPTNHTLERINPNKGYEPKNCKWATWDEQHHNKVNSVRVMFDGKLRTISETATLCGKTSQATYKQYVRKKEIIHINQPH